MNSSDRYARARQNAIARNRAKSDNVIKHEGAELRRILEMLTPDREKAAQQKEKRQ